MTAIVFHETVYMKFHFGLQDCFEMIAGSLKALQNISPLSPRSDSIFLSLTSLSFQNVV